MFLKNRVHQQNDMKDKELKFWTTYPNIFLVAEITESGKIAGCIAYRQLTAKNTIEMHRVYVDSKYRRLGIGRKMVKDLLNIAKENGYDTVYLDTPTSQIAARTLYERMNFSFLKFDVHRSNLIDFFTGLESICYICRIE